MIILDGKALAARLQAGLKARAEAFRARFGRPAGLAVALAGKNEASRIYVRRKLKAAEAVGFHSRLLAFPAKASSSEIEGEIRALAQDSSIHGILIQLPLPSHISQEKLFALLPPEKDPDGLTLTNQALLWAGRQQIAPCTPQGIIRLLEHYDIEIEGAEAVVIGRSQIVGRPMACLLLQKSATVTVCHSKTRDLRGLTLRADIVVAAAGQKWLLSQKDFKKGAVAVDVGMHREMKEGRAVLSGDINPEGLPGHLKALSPVPGGVGPMTVAMLLENTLSLAIALEEGLR